MPSFGALIWYPHSRQLAVAGSGSLKCNPLLLGSLASSAQAWTRRCTSAGPSTHFGRKASASQNGTQQHKGDECEFLPPCSPAAVLCPIAFAAQRVFHPAGLHRAQDKKNGLFENNCLGTVWDRDLTGLRGVQLLILIGPGPVERIR